jgi:hypothetical protein
VTSARPLAAQPLHFFEDLALRVNLGDQLRIEDQSGVKAAYLVGALFVADWFYRRRVTIPRRAGSEGTRPTHP